MQHGRAFLFAPVLTGAGAVLWFSMPRDSPSEVIVALFVLLIGVCAVGQWRLGRMPMAALAASFVLGGALLAQLETWRASTVILDSAVTTTVTGAVFRREAAGEGRWRYFLNVSATAGPTLKRPPEQAILLVRSTHIPFDAGDTIRGRARLSPPSAPALPRLNDFAFGAYYDRIGAVGFFFGAPTRLDADAVPLPSRTNRWGDNTRGQIFALRATIAERIRAVVPGDAGAFAAAIVTDERRAISKETTEALRVSGLAHIVAISGLNMALAAGIFFVGLRTALGWFTGFAQEWPIKKIAAFGALLMATAYYLISGFAVSAERAYLMMSVMLIAVFFDRAAISLRNVAISALVILTVSPSEVMGPSFQMSFAATVALVAGYSIWSRRRNDAEPGLLAKGRLTPVVTGWKFMAGIFVTSLIGGLSTAIYSMEHFHRLAGYGLAANLAVMPIISFLIMPAGLVGMLLMPFGLDAPFLTLMGAGLEAVIAVAKYVSAWGGDVNVGRQHPWFLALASLGFLFLSLLRTRLCLIGLPLMVLAFFMTWQEQLRPAPDLLVSDDGLLVAMPGSFPATNRSRPPPFIFDQWQRVHALSNPVAPLMSPGGDLETSAPDPKQQLSPQQIAAMGGAMQRDMEKAGENIGRFVCRPKLWCTVVTKDGARLVTVEDGRITGLGCDLANLVIAPRAPFDECRSKALLISGKALRRTGALEIHFNGSGTPATWQADAAMIGHARPWTRHRIYDWRSDGFDPTIPQQVSRLVNGSGG